uniref:Uncharacterized protein n=1 Tax=Plectus sambesii TaxID=2011161 RepID=A0A914V0R7_9BILA
MHINTLTTIRPTGGSYAFVSVGPNDPPVGRTRRRELDSRAPGDFPDMSGIGIAAFDRLLGDDLLAEDGRIQDGLVRGMHRPRADLHAPAQRASPRRVQQRQPI